MAVAAIKAAEEEMAVMAVEPRSAARKAKAVMAVAAAMLAAMVAMVVARAAMAVARVKVVMGAVGTVVMVGTGGGTGGNGGGKGGNGGGGHDGRGLASLKTITVPGPTTAELANIIKDKNAAIALGKAFFWEMQFGSDGKTACATCHFNAGADSRTGNQADPGLRRVDGNGFPAADSTTFHAGFGPNHMLSVSDFPLHTSTRDNNNIVGSQGVLRFDFNDVVLGQAAENETSVADSVWSVSDGNGGMINVRRSTPRNAPPVINAVFNYRNFWDGRAQRTFNGVNPFGAGDPGAHLIQVDPSNPNATIEVTFRLSNSALASQAVGPPGSDVEMSATGRPFVKMGKKMLTLTPLGLQQVASDDSVLGSLSAAPEQWLDHGLHFHDQSRVPGQMVELRHCS